MPLPGSAILPRPVHPFCPYPEGRSCFSGDAVCPSRSDSALCPPPAVCPPHPAERSRKALEHRRRTYEELVREFTEDPKDEEVSIDELLLTIDELQKEEQKNT